MLRRFRRAAGVGVLAAGLAAALAGCTFGPEPTPSPTPPPKTGDGVLRIGTLFTTSGPGTAAVAGQTAAVYAAVREIDGTGGVLGSPVEVFNRDGGTTGDGTAEASFAELVERGVDVVIGPSTMELAAVVAPLADAAGIPLILPSATGPRPDGTDGVFRTVPSAAVEAAALGALLAAEGGARVALVRSDDPAGQALAAGLADGLGDAELVVDVVAGADPAADAQQITSVNPDAVLVATAGGGTSALLDALMAAGTGSDALWITGGALARYSDVSGSLEGAHCIRSGVSADPGFTALVRQEDPAARDQLYAPNAYDATVLAALAAVLAGDDGGPSIAANLRMAAGGGIPCGSFGECLDVLTTQTDIDFEGASGSFEFDDAGDRTAVGWVRYRYDADNRPVAQDAASG